MRIPHRLVYPALISVASMLVEIQPVAAATEPGGTPPVLQECTSAVSQVVDPQYGPGWLMSCADGYAVVVPTRRGSWAILYPAGAELSGLPTRNPTWVNDMADGAVQPEAVSWRAPERD